MHVNQGIPLNQYLIPQLIPPKLGLGKIAVVAADSQAGFILLLTLGPTDRGEILKRRQPWDIQLDDTLRGQH